MKQAAGRLTVGKRQVRDEIIGKTGRSQLVVENHILNYTYRVQCRPVKMSYKQS